MYIESGRKKIFVKIMTSPVDTVVRSSMKLRKYNMNTESFDAIL